MSDFLRLHIDQVLMPCEAIRRLDDDAEAAETDRVFMATLLVPTTIYFGMMALGVDNDVVMVAAQTAAIAFLRALMITVARQTRDQIVVALRRYWRWDLGQANLRALELRLAHLRRPYERSRLLTTAILPTVVLVFVVANAFRACGHWSLPAWQLLAGACPVAFALMGWEHHLERQVADRLLRQTCVLPT